MVLEVQNKCRDGWITDGGFEWWYLQLHAPGLALTVVLHATQLLGGQIDQPYLSVTLVEAGEIEYFQTAIEPDTKYFDELGHLKLAPFLEEHADGWHVSIAMPNRLVQCAVRRDSQPWRVADSALVVIGAQEMHWAVPMPRGIWHGQIQTNRGNHRIGGGIAYQDHNWGNAPLGLFARSWTWRCTAGPLRTEVLASVRTPDRRDLSYGWPADPTQSTRTPNNGEVAKDSKRRVVKERTYRGGDEVARYVRWIDLTDSDAATVTCGEEFSFAGGS